MLKNSSHCQFIWSTKNLVEIHFVCMKLRNHNLLHKKFQVSFRVQLAYAFDADENEYAEVEV